jgi:hypothetical protein
MKKRCWYSPACTPPPFKFTNKLLDFHEILYDIYAIRSQCDRSLINLLSLTDVLIESACRQLHTSVSLQRKYCSLTHTYSCRHVNVYKVASLFSFQHSQLIKARRLKLMQHVKANKFWFMTLPKISSSCFLWTFWRVEIKCLKFPFVKNRRPGSELCTGLITVLHSSQISVLRLLILLLHSFLPSPRRYSSGWALASWKICLHSSLFFINWVFLSSLSYIFYFRGWLSSFWTISFLRCEVVSLTPNPQPGGPG